MRYSIRISSIMKPVLFTAGINHDNTYVELGDGVFHVKMGPWFEHQFSLDQIASVAASDWPWYGGLGTKLGPEKGGVGVVASMEGIVALRFKEPQGVKLWVLVTDLNASCNELRISLEEPQAFIQAVQQILEHRPSPRA